LSFFVKRRIIFTSVFLASLILSPECHPADLSLKDMKEYGKDSSSSGIFSIQEGRSAMLRDAALAFGIRGGLAARTDEANERLRSLDGQLSRTYSFKDIMISAPAGFLIQPPVVVKQESAAKISDDGKRASLIDVTYMIVSPGKIRTTSPVWQEYLLRDWPKVTPPDDAVLPQNSAERKLWSHWVEKGWVQGSRQAEIIFEEDLARLDRHFKGMVLYLQLVEEGKIQSLFVGAGEKAIQIPDGSTMKVGLREIAISRSANFVGDINNWKPIVLFRESGLPPLEYRDD